jgi:hypothetical protein
MLLAIGREFVLGSYLGPPLAFWLGELLSGLPAASACTRWRRPASS